MKSTQFEITCRILVETDEAIRVFDLATEQYLWLPMSQVDEIHHRPDDLARVVVSEWIARKKGLL